MSPRSSGCFVQFYHRQLNIFSHTDQSGAIVASDHLQIMVDEPVLSGPGLRAPTAFGAASA
jgi:hypothetical protein